MEKGYRRTMRKAYRATGGQEKGYRRSRRKGYRVQRFEWSWLWVAGEHFLPRIRKRLQCQLLFVPPSSRGVHCTES